MASYLLGTPKKAGIFSYLTLNPITNPYGTHSGFGVEVGCDFGMDLHTPVYALASGTVYDGLYFDCPGGVVGTEVMIPIDPRQSGTPQKAALYYQHIDVIDPAIRPSAHVDKGQLIGYSGGQLSGGYHPNQPACSSGPHIEIGINPPYQGPWNPLGLKPSVDPTHFLAWVASGEATDFLGSVTTAPGFLPLAQQLTDAQRFRPLQQSTLNSPFAPINGLAINTGPLLARSVFVVIGLLLVIGALQALLRPIAEEAQGVGQQALRDAAVLGAL